MKSFLPTQSAKSIWCFVIVIVALAGWLTSASWLPDLQATSNRLVSRFRPAAQPADDPHAHEGHGHGGQDEATSLQLSDQALRNVGLDDQQIRPVALDVFRRSLTVPAVVVERPGRTRVQVATPMTGVITHVHAEQGEAVVPGTLLFRIRLTHEDLVQAQTGFLQTLGEMDVEDREITRLSRISSSGAIAGKVLLERQYAKDKLSALLRAQREALRLHGLSDEQVERIAQDRRLLRELQIVAPSVDMHGSQELKLSRLPAVRVSYGRGEPPAQVSNAPLILQHLGVHQGQSVMAGETLCVLANYDELYVEGLAFEQDIEQLRQASARGWQVDAVFEHLGSEPREVKHLEIAYLANRVDADSRTLRFYVRLPNEVTTDRKATGKRFVEWRFLPGQRLQLRVPVEEWHDQIVLPVDAVAREGAEYFVFQQNGDHFDRVPVHVKYKDQYSTVIENDGSLFPGDVVAMRGAHQLQMALKNKSGGAVDPHAGHSH